MQDEPIDSFDHYPEGKGNQAITLFLVSFIYLFVALLILLYFYSTGLDGYTVLAIIFALSIISFGISLGGLVVGLSERKYSQNWVKTAIVGNILLILLPLILFSVIYFV